MANNIDMVVDKAVLDLITKGTAFTVTTPVKLRLMSVNGTNASNGTEISASGGYTTGGIDTTSKWGSAANVSGQGQVVTTADITWTNMPGGTLNGVELWDSAATPKRLAWGAVTGAPLTLTAGQTLTFSAGQLVLTLA